MGLIQILNHKLSAQSYFLIEVKKKLLYCRIAIREKILKYVNLWCYQAKRTLIQRQPKDRGIYNKMLISNEVHVNVAYLRNRAKSAKSTERTLIIQFPV